MFDINQIYKVDNFLSEDELNGLYLSIDYYPWKFIAFSNDKDKPFRVFWQKDLWEFASKKATVIESCFKEKLEILFNLKLETCRLYLNGQAHGQCGNMHKDVISDDEYDYITLVYYMNKEWEPVYGGFTLIKDSNDNLHIIYPKPNSVVMFNSRFDHVGLEPTIHCNTQRVTLAHKLKIIKE